MNLWRSGLRYLIVTIFMLLFWAGSLSLHLAQAQTGTPTDSSEQDAQAPASGTTEQAPKAASDDSFTLKDILLIAAPILNLLGVGVIVYYTRQNVMAEQRFKANEAEAEFIQNKLDKFYGPFILLSSGNKLLAQDLRSRQDKPDEYRLLAGLFDEEWRNGLSEGDKELVTQICETADSLSGIIVSNAGLVNPEILPYLARVLAHFKILKLAYDKKLGGDIEPFNRYVYPMQLDPVLDAESKRLQERLALIRGDPDGSHGKLEPLDLSAFPLPDWPDPVRKEYDH